MCFFFDCVSFPCLQPFSWLIAACVDVAACLAAADEIQIESVLCGLGDCLAVSNGVDYNQVSGLNVVYNVIKDSFLRGDFLPLLKSKLTSAQY